MLKHASIMLKFTSVVAAMGVAAIAIALAGWIGLSHLKQSMLSVEQTGRVSYEAMDLRIDIIAISRMTYQLAREPAKHADFSVEAERRAKEMLARLPILEAGADLEERRLLADVRTGLETYFGQIRNMLAVARSSAGNPSAMEAGLAGALDAQKIVTDTVKAYTTYSGKLIEGTRKTAFAATDTFLTAQILVALLGIVAGLALSFVVARYGVMSPLRKLNHAMRGIADGDLDSRVDGTDRRDEIGQMATSLQVLREGLVHARTLEEQERAAAAARLARAQSMEAVVSDVGEVVAAAAAGDFSARLEIKDADEQMQRLVAGINEINAVVDSATTEFAGTLSAIAGGDLTNRVETAYRGKFAD
ncbi:HAMP domain-containing protein, partial [Bosea sp. BH3]|uniref:HAMP domain-containing protein n=1 Tax=Bosea sp. BH3 TaxID=2871701 RepID=UPI0021CB6FF3